MSRLEQKYEHKCNTPSDINEHLPTLRRYAEECDHVTEMGVRWIVSTWALLAARPNKLISYDIKNPSTWNANIQEVYDVAEEENLDFTFVEANVLEIEIEETDMLFIDTNHIYEQLSGELKLHADKVRKYIAFHDTTKFKHIGENGKAPALGQALDEFLEANPHWAIKEVFTNNNGLTIIERVA